MSKINKLGKSTFLVAILSFLLVAVLAFGGTYAYFSAQSNVVTGSITTGNLNIGKIDDEDGLIDASDALTFATTVAQPNQTIVDNVFSATATGNIAYYTRVKFEVEVQTVPGDDHKHTKGDTECADVVAQAINALKITTTNAGWEVGSTANGTATKSTAYYYKKAPTAKDSADKTEEFAVKIQLEDFLGRAEAGSAARCPFWMDATISITIQFEVLQADYLNDATGLVVGTEFASGAVAEAAWELALAQTKAPGTEPAPSPAG